MSTLTKRLLSAEDDFLTALEQGTEALASFDRHWEALMNEIDRAMEFDSLDYDTLILVHSTSLRISVLADASIDLFRTQDAYTSELMSHLDSLLSDIALSPKPSQHQLPPSSPRKFETSPPVKMPTSTPSPEALVTKTCKLPKRKWDEDSSSSGTQKRQRTTANAQSVPRSHCLSTARVTSTKQPRFDPPEPASTASRGEAGAFEITPLLLCRKRRASDAELSCRLGGPKRVHLGPRVHAVSDSFTASLNIRDAQRPAVESVPSFPVNCYPSTVVTDTSLNTQQQDGVDGGFTSATFPLQRSDCHNQSSSHTTVDDLDEFLRYILEPNCITNLELDCSTSEDDESAPSTPSTGSIAKRDYVYDFESPISTSSPISLSHIGTPPLMSLEGFESPCISASFPELEAMFGGEGVGGWTLPCASVGPPGTSILFPLPPSPEKSSDVPGPYISPSGTCQEESRWTSLSDPANPDIWTHLSSLDLLFLTPSSDSGRRDDFTN